MYRIREAVERDQAVITRLVREARLNPVRLEWERFVVAEADGEPMGVAQIKLHQDGSRELASLVVRPNSRGQGVAAAMIDALLAEQPGQVFMLVDRRFAAHYRRWRFHPTTAASLPGGLRRQFRIGQAVTTIGSLVERHRIRLVPLLREG